MSDLLLEWINALGGDPVAIGVILLLGTFILEDAATVSGALLAASDLIHPLGAMAALYAGIVLGDMGLYGLGWLGARNSWVQRQLQRRWLAQTGNWIGGRLVRIVIVARFLPGMRLPTYLACGLFGHSFWKFMAAVIFIVGIWTGVLFYLIYSFGNAVLDQIGPWKWPAAIGLILLVFLLPRLIAYVVRKRGLDPTDVTPHKPAAGPSVHKETEA